MLSSVQWLLLDVVHLAFGLPFFWCISWWGLLLYLGAVNGFGFAFFYLCNDALMLRWSLVSNMWILLCVMTVACVFLQC